MDEITQKYGQQVHEQLLSSVATRICRHVRPIDLVGHTQQDEFLIAMYNDNKDDVRCRNFKRILHDLNHRSYKTNAGFISIRCAMSMTVAVKNDGEKDVEALIAATRKNYTNQLKWVLKKSPVKPRFYDVAIITL
ncbi:diguanylate cyclase domain-containing protein [sulfur-oxidizing endosymbiont of Gigantopelta aegis]|uniref:diguanylate cyclase domain-containing protein n=1 Tax=sulfur-oxidizing endosymbiont of Gigantopelta aegis TaxID=2794934 RepID=UPI0018DCCB40|nr:diguanylate cyclase [sulfur-oxidizing endosymbiont of Gigantopelta aegis]